MAALGTNVGLLEPSGRSSATCLPLRVTTKVSPATTASITAALLFRGSRCARVLDIDAWHAWGLGTSGRRVWQATLDPDSPPTVAGIAAATGLHRRTVRRRLDQLTVHGLVGRHGDRYTGRLDVDLDQVAEHVGTTGRGAKRKALHSAQREQHRRRVEAWRQAHRTGHGPPRPQREVLADVTWLVDPDTGELWPAGTVPARRQPAYDPPAEVAA